MSSTTLSIRNVFKEYVSGKPVLRGINLEFSGGGITAIIGPSGTGKSTLIRCINRLVDATSGEIVLNGTNMCNLSRQSLRQARREIGMVFQEYNLVERLSVMENVLSGRLGYMPAWKVWLRQFERKDIDRAFELLDTVGLGSFSQRRADALSGGQRQRVGIARAVMQGPKLMLADEPTSSLDPKTSVEIMQLLREVSSANDFPVIVNIHNVELAKRFCDRIVGMTGGTVVFDGKPGAITDDHLKQIYGGEDWLH
jgi:phosphonate transport system ATP-binding protein